MADQSISASREQWKPVEGFQRYEVSTEGRIRNTRSRNGLKISGRLIRGWIHKVGPNRRYSVSVMVTLTRDDGAIFKFRLHRLVLQAFVGPCPPNMMACHNDGNFRNNRLSNLRWDTAKANSADAKRHGTYKAPKGISGPDNHNAKFGSDVVEIIRATPRGYGVTKALAERFGVCTDTIRHIWDGDTRSTG